MYLLDTDILVFIRRGRHHLQERVDRVGLSNCVVSEISLAELYVGVYKSGNDDTKRIVESLEEMFKAIPVTSALKTFAKIKVQLEQRGLGLDTMDLLIAATALANDYTLVTHNTRHFSRIPDLKLEDWTEQ